MSLDFSAKHGVIARLTDPDKWENVFDDAFFADKRRKWSSTSHGPINVSYNKDYDEDREAEIEAAKKEKRAPDLSEKRAVILTYSGERSEMQIDPDTQEEKEVTIPVKAKLVIEESDIGFLITDERGVTVPSTTPYSEMRSIEDGGESFMDFEQNEDCHRAFIDHLGIVVEFSKTGQKRIGFHRSNSYIELEGPETDISEELKTGQFFNLVHLDGSFLEELARTKQSPMTFITLVAAMDLGLQPSLRSFNGFATDAGEKATQLLDNATTTGKGSWLGAGAWNLSLLRKIGGIAALEKAWRDTAEFNGYRAESPSNFLASMKKDGGVNIQTTSTGKERVLTRGALLSVAMDDGAKRHDLKSDGISHIFSQLADAPSIEDRGNNPWHLITVNHNGNFDGITSLVKSARHDYLLQTDEFAVINISENMAMIAITQEALEKCLTTKPMSAHALQQHERPAASNVVQLRR